MIPSCLSWNPTTNLLTSPGVLASIAAVANFHRLSGLQKHIFILSQF